MKKIDKQKIDTYDIEQRLNEMSKTCTYKSRNLTYDEMYDIIITKAFNDISSSKEKAISFLQSAGIFNDDGHLADEYK